MYSIYCPWCCQKTDAVITETQQQANEQHQQHMRQHIYTDFLSGKLGTEVSKQQQTRLLNYLESLLLDKMTGASY